MLDLYENIKSRRLELDMTQEELAEKTGYSGKSMIAKIEKGKVDLPQSKILLFANALKTTPAYLMGWTSDPDYQPTLKDHFARATSGIRAAIDTSKDSDELKGSKLLPDFTEQEIDLIAKFREIDKDLQRMVISSLETALIMTRERKKEKDSPLSRAN